MKQVMADEKAKRPGRRRQAASREIVLMLTP
jgi:hypothetical protein